MKVTIPKIAEHAGYSGNLMTIEIADICLKCGSKRGTQVWEGLSYDGSKRLNVTCWDNECVHVDKYAGVREEYYNQQLNKENERYNLKWYQWFKVPIIYIMWVMADRSERKETFDIVINGLIKHKHNFIKPFIQNGVQFLMCDHLGCGLCDPIN